MTAPHSHLLEGSPRLHYLEWNAHARRTIILLHGNSANAWWWEQVARAIAPEYRLLALDQRGHGDSEWVRPAAYSPTDYANDIARFVAHVAANAEKAVVVGHSMGGLNVLAFARNHPEAARGAMAIDVAVTSSRGRDRYLRRLKSLPVVTYPDLATAKARFRLMPKEGGIPEEAYFTRSRRRVWRGQRKGAGRSNSIATAFSAATGWRCSRRSRKSRFPRCWCAPSTAES